MELTDDIINKLKELYKDALFYLDEYDEFTHGRRQGIEEAMIIIGISEDEINELEPEEES